MTSRSCVGFDWDEQWYLDRYPDIADAVRRGDLNNPLLHYLRCGAREGRFPCQAAAERASTGADPAPKFNIGGRSVSLDYPVRAEASKSFGLRLANGFFAQYLNGAVVVDVGYRGAHADAVPILPHALGVELDYPGYDGRTLPFPNGSVDTVFSSHVLEHLEDAIASISDWFRVIKIGGFIVCIVPHQYLYEKKLNPPSKWSGEHLRFYTPSTLLRDFETALEPNSYRVRHLADNDLEYRYDLGPEHHPGGCYEIELVVQKIHPPSWALLDCKPM